VVARDSSARIQASRRSVLQAGGARPFTFLAQATSTDQPQSSKVSWTKRAPFIDSITARTSSAPWSHDDVVGARGLEPPTSAV
jgi:hypothetical protein